jgi:hypothetical protein
MIHRMIAIHRQPHRLPPDPHKLYAPHTARSIFAKLVADKVGFERDGPMMPLATLGYNTATTAIDPRKWCDPGDMTAS